MRRPSNRTSPEVGSISRRMHRPVVVLPLPDSPTRPKISPAPPCPEIGTEGIGLPSSIAVTDKTPDKDRVLWMTKKGASLGNVNGMGSAGREYVPGVIHRSDRMASTGLYSDGQKGVRRLTDPAPDYYIVGGFTQERRYIAGKLEVTPQKAAA